MLDDIKPASEFKAWPLHLTLVPWFKLSPDQVAAFELFIRKLLKASQPLIITGTEPAIFGRRALVTLVDDQAILKQLHYQILKEIIKRDGQILATGHLADKFVPHVSKPATGRQLYPFSCQKCPSAALVRKQGGPNPNKIVTSITLN